MYKRNDGLTGDQILQNQFTAFLNTALCNTRKAYLRGKYRRCKREYITDEFFLCPYDGEYIESAVDYERAFPKQTACFSNRTGAAGCRDSAALSHKALTPACGHSRNHTVFYSR